MFRMHITHQAPFSQQSSGGRKKNDASAVYAIVVCLSVSRSVRHKPTLYQNG